MLYAWLKFISKIKSMALFYIAFFVIIVLALILVTTIGKDFYPFSHYPMFSFKRTVSKVIVYRIALEDDNGKIEWWQHEAYRYPEFIGRKLLSNYNICAHSNNAVEILAAQMQKRKLLLHVIRLIDRQNTKLKSYMALHIIERHINSVMQIEDKTIDVISFNKIING